MLYYYLQRLYVSIYIDLCSTTVKFRILDLYKERNKEAHKKG